MSCLIPWDDCVKSLRVVDIKDLLKRPRRRIARGVTQWPRRTGRSSEGSRWSARRASRGSARSPAGPLPLPAPLARRDDHPPCRRPPPPRHRRIRRLPFPRSPHGLLLTARTPSHGPRREASAARCRPPRRLFLHERASRGAGKTSPGARQDTSTANAGVDIM